MAPEGKNVTMMKPTTVFTQTRKESKHVMQFVWTKRKHFLIKETRSALKT